MNRNTKYYKYKRAFLNIVFICSASALTGILSLQHSMPDIFLSVVSSFLLLCILVFRFHIVEKLSYVSNRRYFIPSLLFALVSSTNFISYLNGKMPYILEKISVVVIMNVAYRSLLLKYGSLFLGIMVLYALYLFWNFAFNKFFPSVIDFIFSLDKSEKFFLILTSIFFTFLIFLIYGQTNLFYSPSIDGMIIDYDVVFTSDTGNHLSTNIFANISATENDIRQPLFGLFALPLGVIATIISKLLFFIPHSYAIAIAGLHIIFLNITYICISRILQLKSKLKIMFLLIFTFSYPTLLFSFNIEQYVLSLFWLIAFLYVYMVGKEEREYLYIAATGSLVTSGIWFMFIGKKGELIHSVKIILKTGLQFFMLVVLFGQLPWISNYSERVDLYSEYTGIGLSFTDKISQYVNFVLSCFIAPNAIIDSVTFGYITYQLAPVTRISMLGLIILFLTILGFGLNYNNKFAQICFGWVIYSFVLLCLIGWGTKENGLVLYTLYFSWAFISLIYMAVSKLFEKLPKVKILILSIIIISLFLVNTVGIWKVIQFGIQNYPT